MKIRLWKLGSTEHRIYPTDTAIHTLTDILNSIREPGGDIIWGPDINVELVEIDDSDMNVVVSDFVLNEENVCKIRNFIQGLAYDQQKELD